MEKENALLKCCIEALLCFRETADIPNLQFAGNRPEFLHYKYYWLEDCRVLSLFTATLTKYSFFENNLVVFKLCKVFFPDFYTYVCFAFSFNDKTTLHCNTMHCNELHCTELLTLAAKPICQVPI